MTGKRLARPPGGGCEFAEQTQRNAVARAVLTGWLVPGAGHWMLGERGKGALVGVILLALFTAGFVMGGEVMPPGLRGSLHVLEWIGNNIVGALSLAGRMGCGAVAVTALAARWRGDPAMGAYYEVGGAFMTVAGVLNVLALISLFEVGKRRGTGRGRSG